MNGHKRSSYVKLFDSQNDLEIDHLKDLLLVNLELIQHQEELILANNKTIQSLLNENELLKHRLEKVERRLKLNRNESSKCRQKRSCVRPTRMLKNKCHQKSINGMPKLFKEETSLSVNDVNISTPPNIQTDLIADNSNDTLIQTPFNEVEIANCNIIDIEQNDGNIITVPSWRIKPIHTLYIMEGTENLDDFVFERRHQKPENEEKRRKRWDLQRLREIGLIKKNNHHRDYDNDDEEDIKIDIIEITDETANTNTHDMLLRNISNRKYTI